jgi:hypothetical protein
MQRAFALMAVMACLPVFTDAQLPISNTPVPPQLSLIWIVHYEPDAEAKALGFTGFDDTCAILGTTFFSAALTGWGCVDEGFGFSGELSVAWTGEESQSFVAVRSKPKREKDEAVALRWNGILDNGPISGDVEVTTSGSPVDAKDLKKLLEDDRARIFRERAVYNNNGEILNQAQVEQMGNAASGRLLALRGRGRTVRYSFRTIRTRITAIGYPTTKPSTQQVERHVPTTRPSK